MTCTTPTGNALRRFVCDFILAPFAPHPNPNPVLAPLAPDFECGKRCNQPFLKSRHKRPHILPAIFNIKHDIGHPLTRPVISILPAAPRVMNRKERRQNEVAVLGRGARRIKRRMLEQPHQFCCLALGNRLHLAFHPRHRRLIGNRIARNLPAHGSGTLQFWPNGKAGRHFPSFPNFDNQTQAV